MLPPRLAETLATEMATQEGNVSELQKLQTELVGRPSKVEDRDKLIAIFVNITKADMVVNTTVLRAKLISFAYIQF